MNQSYSTQELMIIAGAGEIRDLEVFFFGMRLQKTAFGVTKLTHAPDALELFECGIARNTSGKDMLYTMSGPPNQERTA